MSHIRDSESIGEIWTRQSYWCDIIDFAYYKNIKTKQPELITLVRVFFYFSLYYLQCKTVEK